MDAHDLVPEQRHGATRRQLLRAGALGGALVWSAPTVQVLSLTPASAQTASGGTPPCTTIGTTSGYAYDVAALVAGRLVEGTRASSAQSGLGDPAEVRFGPGTAGVGSATATTDELSSDSFVDATTARTEASAVVESLVLTLSLPGAGVITVETLTSSATATATKGVLPVVRSGAAQVIGLQVDGTSVTVPAGSGSIGIPELLPVVFLDFRVVELSSDGLTVTATALRVRVPSGGVLASVAQSSATAQYPGCP